MNRRAITSYEHYRCGQTTMESQLELQPKIYLMKLGCSKLQ